MGGTETQNIPQISSAEKNKVCEILKEISNFISSEANTHTYQEIKGELTRIREEKEYTVDPLQSILPIRTINYDILNGKKDEDETVNEILKDNKQLFDNQLTA